MPAWSFIDGYPEPGVGRWTSPSCDFGAGFPFGPTSSLSGVTCGCDSIHFSMFAKSSAEKTGRPSITSKPRRSSAPRWQFTLQSERCVNVGNDVVGACVAAFCAAVGCFGALTPAAAAKLDAASLQLLDGDLFQRRFQLIGDRLLGMSVRVRQNLGVGGGREVRLGVDLSACARRTADEALVLQSGANGTPLSAGANPNDLWCAEGRVQARQWPLLLPPDGLRPCGALSAAVRGLRIDPGSPGHRRVPAAVP